jgi:anti-sigma factor RsiW
MSERSREAELREGLAEREERTLHAYHDGELRGFARWRFERRLARSPALQHELRSLAELGEALRARRPQAREPELWDRIALRLPAEDARRAAAAAEAIGPRRRLAWLPPLGAATAALVVAALVAQQWLATPVHPRAGVVRWMDSRGRSVMVLEDDAKSEVTIIWLLDGEAPAGTAGGARAAS